MKAYLTRDWLGEKSTRYGSAGVAVGLLMFLAGFAPIDERVTSAFQQLSITILGVGLVAILYPEKKP